MTSRRGTTVNVSGSGFPSGDLVQVKYDNNGDDFVTVAAGSADASGAASIDFTVPSYARSAPSTTSRPLGGVFKGVTAKATHETPGAMVTLSTPHSVRREHYSLRYELPGLRHRGIDGNRRR